MVVRSADGAVVDAALISAVWNDLWKDNLCIGAFPRPIRQAGKYTFEIYFNALALVKQDITVTE